jgi:NAD(P)-dependent dehydrogenase (short-subunit alcohol dehydrogenase family)
VAGLVEGKVALVTGAASGIGRASALAFAREGARVLACDLDAEGGEAACAAIRAAGGEALFERADVSREAEVARLVGRALETWGRLDCAHNNAGVLGPTGPLHEIELDAFERVLATNLTGVFLCLKHELRAMRAQGGGAIVNTSSGAGRVGAAGLAAYCASKHAILGLTRSAALENARRGVRVNAICPGGTDTPMLRAAMAGDPRLEKLVLAGLPAGRLAAAEEVAEAAVWLCSERAGFVSGEALGVDGGALAR